MPAPVPRRDPAPTSRPAGPAQPDLVASGPTALRIALGSQLRRLREAHGITCEAAGRVIRASASKISRLEHGRVSMKQRDLADLLTLYGVTGEAERADGLRLAREAARPGWWHQYGGILPGWFEFYIGLESAASRIRTYEMQFVPGLLQTPEYARAVIRGGHPAAPPEEIARRVSLRMKRQQILSRPDGPKLWAVVDETALRRRLGAPGVMEAQLGRLVQHPALRRARTPGRGVPGAADQCAVPG
jgi:transcriptional regulator with XRE-family HTH domain